MANKFNNDLKGIYQILCNQTFMRFCMHLQGKGLNIDTMTETEAQLEATSYMDAESVKLHDLVEGYFNAD